MAEMAEKQLDETAVSDVEATSPTSASIASEDQEVMAQLGVKQQLKRRFNLFSIFGLSITLLSSWEALASSLGVSLAAGGPVALIWGLFFALAGTFALAASISEMASMCPISGAQYHWSYMFAPKKWRVLITFMQGWTTVFAWQATITSLTYLTVAQVQGLVVMNWPNYDLKTWHTVLLMWLLLLIAYVANVWTVSILPITELCAGALHILLFITLFVVLLVMGRNASAEFVFTKTINNSGWENNGVAWFIGLLPCVWCIIGFDGAIHLSEETKNAARTIPKVIMSTVLVNGSMAWIFALLALFGIADFDAVLASPTGYPIMEIYRQVVGSKAGATAIEAFVLSINIFALFGTLASVSRLTWAFARDDGLPFSNYFKHVDPTYKVPVRAISLVSIVIVLLSLINIGSSVALNAILSLSSIGLYVSYIIPIACLLTKRLRLSTRKADSAGQAEVKEDEIAFGPFTLGRFGPLVNLFAICYASLLVPFLALPTALPLTNETMNYAGPVFLAVLAFAGLDYAVRGRHKFHGPTRERD